MNSFDDLKECEYLIRSIYLNPNNLTENDKFIISLFDEIAKKQIEYCLNIPQGKNKLFLHVEFLDGQNGVITKNGKEYKNYILSLNLKVMSNDN